MLTNPSGPVLVLAAHPDDEVLGCGGLLARLAKAGTSIVSVAFLTDGIGSRQRASAYESTMRQQQSVDVANRLDFTIIPSRPISLDNEADQVSRLKLAGWASYAIDEARPSVVLTHHASDLNVDHRRVYEATMIATRPTPGQCVREVYAFEVCSSTEWGDEPFRPTVFVDISDAIDDKLAAMAIYQSECFEFPHARSVRAIDALARHRGATVGMHAAEGYELIRLLE